jgi:hypothetical protein
MQIEELVGSHLVEVGAISSLDTPFSKAAIALMQQNLELVQDSDKELAKLARYPLRDTLADGLAQKFKEDNLKEICEAVLAQYDSGVLPKVRACPPFVSQLLHCQWRLAGSTHS